VRLDTSPRGELERLYRDQWDRMWRAVFAFAGDREIASDAVAEAFAQALKERGRQGPEPTEGTYEMNDLARDLVAALAKLPPKQRAAVVLHHSVGYPAKEIAPIIGSSTPGVHVLLTRGRKRLRELLETDDA
jgi:DNA-directed RNA polymerase specialized sigma24 family protein